MHDWRLFNYPERLSYSATPPDFGSLSIERRRWANGGLLILGKLHRTSRARRAAGNRIKRSELFLRWNYMASISWSSTSLPVLLAFPFSATLISPLLGVIALPYFIAMASDLRYCGYKPARRVPHLRLQPHPARRQPGRHPLLHRPGHHRVQGTLRPHPQVFATAPSSPRSFSLPRTSSSAWPASTLYHAYVNHLTENTFYAAMNVVLACYAVVAFIGLRNSLVDLWIHGTAPLYRSAKRGRRRPILLKRQVEE